MTMTEQEAKEQLEAFFQYDLTIYEEISVRRGIKALEKQIPQEVVNQGGTPLSGHCPRCNAELTKPSSPVGCKWCLQKLKWEGEQEE